MLVFFHQQDLNVESSVEVPISKNPVLLPPPALNQAPQSSISHFFSQIPLSIGARIRDELYDKLWLWVCHQLHRQDDRYEGSSCYAEATCCRVSRTLVCRFQECLEDCLQLERSGKAKPLAIV